MILIQKNSNLYMCKFGIVEGYSIINGKYFAIFGSLLVEAFRAIDKEGLVSSFFIRK